MSTESLIAIPPDPTDPVVLRRILSVVVEELDAVTGKRPKPGITSIPELEAQIASLQEQLNESA